MTNVLIIAAVKPEWSSFLQAAADLRRAGAKVRVACAFDPHALPKGDLLEVHRLAADLRGRRGRRPRRFTPGWAWVVVRNRGVRTRIRRAKLLTRVWLISRYDPWIQREAARADFFVALEQRAVYTAWRLARKHRAAAASLGIRPVQDALEDLNLFTAVASTGGLRSRQPDEVVAAWNSLRLTLGHRAAGQLLRRAPRVVRVLRRFKALEDAVTLSRSALAQEPSAEIAAWLRLELTAAQIAQLSNTDYPLRVVAREALEFADSSLLGGRLDEAVDLAISVEEAVFHRELHAEVEWSPLTDDPESFLAPLRSSLTYAALAASAGSMSEELGPAIQQGSAALPRPRTIPIGQQATATRRRVLVVSWGNLHFAEGILADLEEVANAEIRRLVLPDEAGRFARRDVKSMMIDRISEAAGRHVPELPPDEAALLAWPDTIFVDWCDNAAVWTLLHAPRHARVVVRIHSIEAVSHQPHMLDWSRVDDVVFVGAHVREFMLRAVPSLKLAARVHVVPNEIRLERFGLPKRSAARRTVAMIGWGHQVKDAIWAVDILARLRADDTRWQLLLIGRDFAESQTESGAAYRARFRERASMDDVRPGIRYAGHADNMPEVLRDAGFVISASRRESFGVGLTEGAASAAVPVVRNWPLYAAYDGARAVYPPDWVVEDQDAAIARILEHSDETARRIAGEEARSFALKTFDWPVVADSYREILLSR